MKERDLGNLMLAFVMSGPTPHSLEPALPVLILNSSFFIILNSELRCLIRNYPRLTDTVFVCLTALPLSSVPSMRISASTLALKAASGASSRGLKL